MNTLVALRRTMGWRDLVLFYVVTSFNLQWVQKATAAGASAIVIWVGACLLFYVPLVLAVMELSSRYPEQGGIYIWTQRAFGPFSGFLTGWGYWFCNIPYFPLLLYFVAASTPFLFGDSTQHLVSDPRYTLAVSLAGLTFCVVLNIVGLNIGKWLHNIGAFGMGVPTVVLLVVAFVAWRRFGSATAFTRASFVPSVRIQDMIFWSTIAFAYAGVENASIMGGEIDETPGTIPRALIIAGITITVLFIAATVAVIVSLPMGQLTSIDPTLQGVFEAMQRASRRINAGWVVPIATGCLVIGVLGQVGGWFAAAARLPYAAAVDGRLPRIFGRLHPTWRTPHIAMLVQGAAAIGVMLLGQTGATVKSAYNWLLAASVITYFVPYLYLFASLIRVQREPVGPDIVRVPGGRPAAIACGMVGFATSAVALVLAAVPPADEPRPVFYLTKLIGLSVGVFALGALCYLATWPRLRSTSASNAAEQFSRLE